LSPSWRYPLKKRSCCGLKFRNLAIITGILQGLAIIPGLSRSGATIFGLSLGKTSPSEILKISYMMSAPVVLALSAFLFWNNPDFITEGWPALLFSFFVGLFSLKIIFRIANRVNFFKFAIIFALFCFLGGVIELIF